MRQRYYLMFAVGFSAALFNLLGPIVSTHAAEPNTQRALVMLWYQAFDKNEPELLDKILSATWADIPPAPNQPLGPAGAKQILVELKTAMPDLKIVVHDILEDGNKVVVRSEISGTHKAALMGFPARNRKMNIQAIDIHEIESGRIARTWHTEDWLTGLHQLGAFDK